MEPFYIYSFCCGKAFGISLYKPFDAIVNALGYTKASRFRDRVVFRPGATFDAQRIYAKNGERIGMLENIRI
ncbi:MAG: hypothetical protein KJ606_13800 [Chloroflexi bacterium]|nr:hypothetical protein [Chloroflexota bacterium]